MLILARKENQSIMIDENIEVVVVSIKGDHVKIGIKAPNEVKIYRKEIYEEIQKENIAASNIDPNQLANLGELIKKNKK